MKFDVNRRNEAIKIRIVELKGQLAKARKNNDDLGLEWRKSHYSDEEVYSKLLKSDNIVRELEVELEWSELIIADKRYCNQHFYTDVEPWEVIADKSDKCLLIRKMKAELKDDAAKKLNDSFIPGGFFGHTNNSLQEWNIISDENGEVREVRLHKDGCYHLNGDKGTRFRLSLEPRKYYDYNF